METPSTPPPEESDVLNANRTVIDEGTAPAATAAPSRSTIPATPTPTRDAAFDWRVLWPWAVAILLLLLIVYLLTRRRSGGASSGGAA